MRERKGWRIKLNKVKEKREIMRKRRGIKDKEIRISDDLTWRQQKMKWKLEDIARRERGK